MFDLWENARHRVRDTGGDDKVPPRATSGLVPSWGPIRHARLQCLMKGDAPHRPTPSRIPGPDHLAWALECYRQAGSTPPEMPVVAAALDMLDGTIADLPSPTDRTAALALAAIATALAGHPAHLICLAETSAARTHDTIKPIVGAANITLAHIPDEAGIDARTQGHGAQVVIATASRFAQDRLRDQALLGGRSHGTRYRVEALAAGRGRNALIRGVSHAFVDDADLVMIETPRPIGFSADPEDDANRIRAEEAFVILRGMASGTHYQVDTATRRIQLTPDGEALLELSATLFEGPWLRRHWREETILAALTIRDFFQPGQDYSIEGDQVVLTGAPASSGVEPGIDALIAAKENLGHNPTLSRIWSYRSFLSSYRHLAGTGFATHGLRAEFAASFGLKVRGRSVPQATPAPSFQASTNGRWCHAGTEAETVFWVPTPADTKRQSVDVARSAIAEQIFALPQSPKRIVQLATAPERWEQRLRATHPLAEIEAFASAQDGFLETLDPDHTALKRFQTDQNSQAYRAVQEALTNATQTRRAAHLKSDRYFERILAFAGDGP